MTILSGIRGMIRRLDEARLAPGGVHDFGAHPAGIDLADPRVLADPFPHYEALRRAGDVHYLPRHKFWLVLGYDAVKSAFDQPELFSSRWRGEVDHVLIGADPPRHAAIRRIVSRHFSADALTRLTATAERLSEELIRPELDIVSDFAGPIARGVAAELIGFDSEAVAEIVAVPLFPFPERTRALDGIAHRARLYQSLTGDGGSLGESEARSLIRLLWMASTASTQRMITYGVMHLLEGEAVRQTVQADRNLLPRFIEEIARLHPAELIVLRGTTQAATLADVTIPANAEVQLCVAAANRDPAYFDDPAELQLDRSFKRHLAFGSGIHHCVGAPLSRRVAAAALGTLLDRSRGLRALQGIDSLPWFRSVSELCPEQLVVGL